MTFEISQKKDIFLAWLQGTQCFFHGEFFQPASVVCAVAYLIGYI